MIPAPGVDVPLFIVVIMSDNSSEFLEEHPLYAKVTRLRILEVAVTFSPFKHAAALKTNFERLQLLDHRHRAIAANLD